MPPAGHTAGGMASPSETYPPDRNSFEVVILKYLSIDQADDRAAPGALASAVIEVTNVYGRATSDTLTAEVFDSTGAPYAGTTTTVTRLGAGLYRLDVGGLDDDDRYLIVVAGTDTSVQFAVTVDAGVPVPDLAAIKTYLGDSATQYTDPQIQAALDAETQRQRDVCTIPALYPASLADALRRRVARNLAAQALPLAYRRDPEGSAIRLAGEDAIVKRIESAYPASPG